MRKTKAAGLLLLAGVWAWTGGTAMAEGTLTGSAADDYTVTVNDGDYYQMVYGRNGPTSAAEVSGGHVIMKGGTVNTGVYGGVAENDGLSKEISLRYTVGKCMAPLLAAQRQ